MVIIYNILIIICENAIGNQTGFGIFDMRDKMRELALEKISKPWHKLKPAQYVDHSVNPYATKKKDTHFENYGTIRN
jgi:hypothetical protein